MLHTDRLRVLANRRPGDLLVHEIYASIQGESTYAGLPCTFIRLTGCPLRCRWCDTPHAFTEGVSMPVAAVMEQVQALPPKLVELTGGEPLSQFESIGLMRDLADAGYKVLIETSGALPIDEIDPRVTIILDLKCPGSGEVDANRYENLRHLKPSDEVKFVVSSRSDFDWAVEKIREHQLLGSPLLISPVHGEVDLRDLAGWIVDFGMPIRMQIQMHKVIWDPKQRGV